MGSPLGTKPKMEARTNSTTVPMSNEIEVHMQDTPLEDGLEALLVRVLPLFVDYAKGNVLRQIEKRI